MAAPSILTAEEERFLRELVREGVEFMIVGLAAAALQGAPAVTQAIDLWFKNLADPGLGRALRKVGGAYVPPVASNPPMLVGKGVALFDIVMTMHGLKGFDKEIKDALEVRLGRTKVRVLPLDRIIASKKAAGRAKDRLVLPMLENAAATLRAARPRRRRPGR